MYANAAELVIYVSSATIRTTLVSLSPTVTLSNLKTKTKKKIYTYTLSFGTADNGKAVVSIGSRVKCKHKVCVGSCDLWLCSLSARMSGLWLVTQQQCDDELVKVEDTNKSGDLSDCLGAITT